MEDSRVQQRTEDHLERRGRGTARQHENEKASMRLKSTEQTPKREAENGISIGNKRQLPVLYRQEVSI